ncbi:hypothetical protein AB1Y20_002958 [Prymnesium parvum]|uniref:Orn/Lys/Arg decarboxylases family 1 pyridoxal-P attachment site domain-containing protein n=1 Tax=Prymnesium parvum TaxID=97485 RepID=A0AB34J9H2_PRYPA
MRLPLLPVGAPQLSFAPEQDALPLLDAVIETSRSIRAPFFFPGHKMGLGAPLPLRQRLVSRRALRHDLPELPELDNLFAAEGAIHEAERLAALAFGAGRSWLLVNGSTAGVLAAGGRRCLGVPIDQVEAGLQRYGSRVAAVLVVSPTYQGVLSDVGGIARLTRAAGVPLIVDEAHGGHLHFLCDTAPVAPGVGLARPRSALSEGADIVVQSTHKMLGSLTQSAMLHAKAVWPQPCHHSTLSALHERNACGAQMTSSSPSYLLLGSLDAARWQFASRHGGGRAALHRACEHAAALRSAVGRMANGPTVLQFDGGAGVYAMDPLRITLSVQDGFALDEALVGAGIYSELPEALSITFALSAGTRARHVRRLVRKLNSPSVAKLNAGREAHTRASALKAAAVAASRSDSWSKSYCSPREAFFRGSRSVPAAKAIGQISAALVCPYPPGIPILIPGEEITAEAVSLLHDLRAAGCSITGCADNSMATFDVLE